MAVLKNQTNPYLSAVFGSLAIGSLIFAVLMISTATQLKTLGYGILAGRVGPLSLFELSKQDLGSDKFTGAIRFNSVGLLGYTLSLVVVGLLIGWLMQRQPKHRQRLVR